MCPLQSLDVRRRSVRILRPASRSLEKSLRLCRGLPKSYWSSTWSLITRDCWEGYKLPPGYPQFWPSPPPLRHCSQPSAASKDLAKKARPSLPPSKYHHHHHLDQTETALTALGSRLAAGGLQCHFSGPGWWNRFH